MKCQSYSKSTTINGLEQKKKKNVCIPALIINIKL